jgi:hypothetical protein
MFAAMGNSFGIALNPTWTEWAVKQGVLETIAGRLSAPKAGS